MKQEFIIETRVVVDTAKLGNVDSKIVIRTTIAESIERELRNQTVFKNFKIKVLGPLDKEVCELIEHQNYQSEANA